MTFVQKLLAVVLFAVAVVAAPVAAQDTTGQPAAFADCEGCPQMIVLPNGVTFGQHLVTVDEFALFARETGFDGKTCVRNDGAETTRDDNADWEHPSPDFLQAGDHPVVCVSWLDATDYADWLSQKTGHSYRLPTLEESQAAAAAGATTQYFWGDDIADVCTHINAADETYKVGFPKDTRQLLPCSDGYLYTSPVEAFPPNAWGVYDPVGNAWQWTNSCLKGDCANAIFWGGGWNVPNPKYFQLAESFGGKIQLRNFIIGFRVMRDE